MGKWAEVWKGYGDGYPQGGQLLSDDDYWYLKRDDTTLLLKFNNYMGQVTDIAPDFSALSSKQYRVRLEFRLIDLSDWVDVGYVYIDANEDEGDKLYYPSHLPNDYTNNAYYTIYEYVKTPPSTPSNITVNPSEVKEGENISISWGSGSGASKYYLYRSINGGSYTQIYSGSSRSRSETALASWNTVRYRVRSYNVDGYSSYRTSSTITVKHFPEFQMRVGGALKASDNGWVRVGGQLREIETMWVKVNGIVKEVK